MIPIYKEQKEKLYLICKNSRHEPPHLHRSTEIIYITQGEIELGIGQEFFHMEQGDLAVIFPDVIHHCQVFTREESKACYLWVAPVLSGNFENIMQKYCPKNPVIKRTHIHNECLQAMECLIKDGKEKDRNSIVEQAYVQILLARSIERIQLIEKNEIEEQDIIYQVVAHIAKNFREEISLESMSGALGINKYSLSRVFSKVFHSNFKQYLNEQRLNYVSNLLECTDKNITEICMDAGFESQRTFNRVFHDRFKMTPREYRKFYQEQHLVGSKKNIGK